MRSSSSVRKVVLISIVAATALLVNIVRIRSTVKNFYSLLSNSDETVVARGPLNASKDEKVTLPPPAVNATIESTEKKKAKQRDSTVCTEIRSSNFSRFTRYRPMYELSDFLVGPGLNDTKDNASAACCQFNYKVGSNWFPHFMQQIYRCWSYWCHTVPFSWNETRQRSREPVLVYNPKAARGRKSSFYEGILAALRDAAGVKVVADSNFYNNSVTTKLADNGRIRDYAMLPGHGQILTQLIAQHYSLDPAKAGCSNQNSFPRIAILNRKGSRTFLNVDSIADKVQAFLPENTTLPVVYFEGTSFLDQVQFFRNTDIVVAPHGASLTGVNFLPPCGYVMEVFPVGYDIPGLFGSLAVHSGHQHGYLMLSNTGNFRREHAEAMKSFANRNKAREAKLCPPTDMIADAVQKMVQEWRSCCIMRNK